MRAVQLETPRWLGFGAVVRRKGGAHPVPRSTAAGVPRYYGTREEDSCGAPAHGGSRLRDLRTHRPGRSRPLLAARGNPGTLSIDLKAELRWGLAAQVLLAGFHHPGDCAHPSLGKASRAPLRAVLAPGRGTWKNRPARRSCAPANWYGWKVAAHPALAEAPKDQEVGALSHGRAWARLLAEVRELDVMACPRVSRISAIAVTVDPAQIRETITCLQRHGRGLPSLG